jgi:hypothetical protein
MDKCCQQSNTIDVDTNATFFYKMMLVPGSVRAVERPLGNGVSTTFINTSNAVLKRETKVGITPPQVSFGGDYWMGDNGNQIGCVLDQDNKDLFGGLSIGEYITQVIVGLEGAKVDDYVNQYFSMPGNNPVSYVRQHQNAEELAEYGVLVAIRPPDGRRDRWNDRLTCLQYSVTFPVHFKMKVKMTCCQDCDRNFYIKNLKSSYKTSDIPADNAYIDNRMTC